MKTVTKKPNRLFGIVRHDNFDTGQFRKGTNGFFWLLGGLVIVRGIAALIANMRRYVFYCEAFGLIPRSLLR